MEVQNRVYLMKIFKLECIINILSKLSKFKLDVLNSVSISYALNILQNWFKTIRNALSHSSGDYNFKTVSRTNLSLTPVGEDASLPLLASGVCYRSLVILGL